MDGGWLSVLPDSPRLERERTRFSAMPQMMETSELRVAGSMNALSLRLSWSQTSCLFQVDRMLFSGDARLGFEPC